MVGRVGQRDEGMKEVGEGVRGRDRRDGGSGGGRGMRMGERG